MYIKDTLNITSTYILPNRVCVGQYMAELKRERAPCKQAEGRRRGKTRAVAITPLMFEQFCIRERECRTVLGARKILQKLRNHHSRRHIAYHSVCVC